MFRSSISSSSSVPFKGKMRKGLSFMIGIAFLIGFLIGMEIRLGLEGSTLLGPTLLEQQQLEEKEKLEREEKEKMTSPKSYLELLSFVFHQRKDVVEKKLESEFAHYYGLTFDTSFLHQQLFVGSHERLLRRIMLKIINAQKNKHIKSTKGENQNHEENDEKATTTLTWVTTGDSTAAADGNYFFQSYTNVLEDTVKEAFATVGIDFHTKNYATSYHAPGSSMEPYICMESIFGTDIDILSWDTLPSQPKVNVDTWSNYANRHPTKPILFLMDDIHIPSSQQFLSLENTGIPAIFMNQDALLQLYRRYPDATDVTKDPNKLPLPLQYLVCYGMPEGIYDCDDANQNFRCPVKGEETKCSQNRFDTQQLCPPDEEEGINVQQTRQVSWNPGWKEHLIKGRLLGYYFLDLLEESILRLDTLETDIDREFFSGQKKKNNVKEDIEILEEMELYLQKQMDRDAFLYQQSATIQQQIKSVADALYPAFCQSSLLLETNQLLPVSFEMPIKATTGDGNTTIPLTVTPLKDFGHCERVNAPREGKMIVREGYGWHSITVTVPLQNDIVNNDESLVRYNKGIIMLCFQFCVDSNDNVEECYNPSSSMEGLNVIKIVHGNINIVIDEIPVIDAEEIEGCFLLKNERGPIWWDSEQQQDRTHYMQLRVNEPNSKVEITSLIFL